MSSPPMFTLLRVKLRNLRGADKYPSLKRGAWALRQDAFRSEFDSCITQAEWNWAYCQGWWEEEG